MDYKIERVLELRKRYRAQELAMLSALDTETAKVFRHKGKALEEAIDILDDIIDKDLNI